MTESLRWEASAKELGPTFKTGGSGRPAFESAARLGSTPRPPTS